MRKKTKIFFSKIQQQLTHIFGNPDKKLSSAEEKKEKLLLNKIEEIYQKQEQLSPAQQKQFETYVKKIEQYQQKSSLTEDEKQKLEIYQKRLDSLKSQHSQKPLSEEDEQLLQSYYNELDELYGIKKPSQAQLGYADHLFERLNNVTQNAQMNPVGLYGALGEQKQHFASHFLEIAENIFTDFHATTIWTKF